MARALRMEGESDEAFRGRAERAAVYARILVQACLANRDVQRMVADPNDPLTEDDAGSNPIVRIDYEQAIALATIGEGIWATRNKHWGDGPNILPLEPDDPVYGRFIVYLFKENSIYNRRFLQRQRLKELLGRKHRPLVERAKYRRHTKHKFLESLTPEEVRAIQRRIGVEPGAFWRACRGTTFLDLPPRVEQTYFEFMCED